MAAVAGSIPTNAIKLMHIVIRVDVLLTLAAALLLQMTMTISAVCSVIEKLPSHTHTLTHTGGHTLLMIMMDKCAPSSAYVTLLSNIESYQQLNRKANSGQLSQRARTVNVAAAAAQPNDKRQHSALWSQLWQMLRASLATAKGKPGKYLL